MDRKLRQDHNEAFLKRLLARRPHDREAYKARFDRSPDVAMATFEGPPVAGMSPRELVLETIVDEERPVLFVKEGRIDTTDVTTLGPEAVDLVNQLDGARSTLEPRLPLVGRIDVTDFPNVDYVGTGWFVDTDIVVTNRHVASLIASSDSGRFVFRRGAGARRLEPSFCNAHEYDDLVPDAERVFSILEVLYIEPDSWPHDIAFVRVTRRISGAALPYIPVAASDIAADLPVCVVGYPARAPRRLIPDQELMDRLYGGRYDVKRAAPGFSMGTGSGTSRHDCSTLGGNSGSVVLDLAGSAVGLHFAGRYHEANFAVPASVLSEYVRRKRWNTPPELGSGVPPSAPSPEPPPTVPTSTASAADLAELVATIPLTIRLTIGAPVVRCVREPAPSDDRAIDVARAEGAALAFWNARPEGVLATRVGFLDDGDRVGDFPCIAVAVAPERWASFESSAPRTFQGVPIRYLPADPDEQIQALPDVESVDSIAYDDEARTGAEFSFLPVYEDMDVELHVGPEYSWDVLEKFLGGASKELVVGMYEFHARHIKDAIERRLAAGVSLTMLVDNATFSDDHGRDDEFDRADVFKAWADERRFERLVAPEGRRGLISDSYHIKVAVRDDDTFWLSSGNWKPGSSQPVITQEQRNDATAVDLPGNREWHVVVTNKTLADRFRSHIAQDFKRAAELGAGPVPKRLEEETFVDVALEEAPVLERRPPTRVLKPGKVSGRIKVRPLLTPDLQGEVYSEAVLSLIRSAKRSLLFQIPYIKMPSDPGSDRGYIDMLIRALTTKLRTLEDARVILRSGGRDLSNPTHAAWYFKSKGVDIAARLRVIEDHHTKGMIVDGRRVLIGSHNWSKPGVTLNRDASLLFDDEEIAGYFAEAFEIDWGRSNAVKPRRYLKPESVVLEAKGSSPLPGYRRVRLSDWLKDE